MTIDLSGAKPIPGATGYFATTDGRIVSTRLGGRVLRPCPAGRGYLTVTLRRHGMWRKCYIHRLVCEAFYGAPAEGAETRHLDGDKRNNRPTNLAWGTTAENVADNHRLGVYAVGETNPRAKLTINDARRIRELKNSGLSQPQIAKRFGISRQVVQSIHTGHAWTCAG